jgi:hypothetical protein
MQVTVRAYDEENDTFSVRIGNSDVIEIDAHELQLSDYDNAEEPSDLVGRTLLLS